MSTALRADRLHRTAHTSDNKCGKQGQKLNYAPKKNMVFTVPIFTKLILTQYSFVNDFCTEFYRSRTKNATKRVKCLFTHLGKEGVRLSVYGI
jgi:hypothetical protein